jgi:surface carbohydrate biosynthesis protein (TIGR04326 family)
VILCHSSNIPKGSSNEIWCWDDPGDQKKINSLLKYVEENSDRLRKEYLKWIADIGEFRINGKTVIQNLEFKEGESFWWLSALVEKSIYKSPFSDAIRLLAFNEIILQKKCKALQYIGHSKVLCLSLRDLSAKHGMVFDFKPSGISPFSLNHAFKLIPWRIKAILFFTNYVRKRWVFRKSTRSPFLNNREKSVFFCGFFFNISEVDANSGRHKSPFWGKLPKFLSDKGLRANWLNIYLDYKGGPSAKTALNWIEKFNDSPNTEGCHAFIHRQLSFAGIMRVLVAWFRLQWKARTVLGKIKVAFRPEGYSLTLWYLLSDNLYNSFLGPVSISSLIWYELFDQEMAKMPKQSIGFYINENQNWEKALLHAWRKHGHGRIIAVPHATVRYWDLRYFNDPRTFSKSSTHPVPKPDLYALNGNAARDAFLNGGYPRDIIVECEALRYEYMGGFSELRRNPKEKTSEPVKILLLGDYLEEATSDLLQLAMDSLTHLDAPAGFSIKPHPNFPVNPRDYSNLILNVVNGSFEELLPKFDVVFASNLTSASVDAYLAGIPVIVINAKNDLNFSPLRGYEDVAFVSTGGQLSDAIKDVRVAPRCIAKHTKYFYLDANLPRWKQILLSSD